MLFIIFIIIIVIYLNNQKKVYNKTSNKKTYTYPDKNKKKVDPNIRDLSSKKVSKKENLDSKNKVNAKKESAKINISENQKNINKNKELVIEDVKDTLDENDDIRVENNKSDFKFNAKEAFIYSEIFNRKY